ncbi:MAG: TldD/PmbA family protein [Marinovum sp.]|nr:TldD/PmbA family protein [Marinovum sp.]
MDTTLEGLTEALLDAAKKAGADAADAIAIAGTTLEIDVRNGVLEQAQRAEATDIGLRIFVGQQQASVSASDTSKTTLKMMAERAVAMAKDAPEDPYAGLADADDITNETDATWLELASDEAEPTPEDLQTLAARAEAAAAANPGVTQVQSSSAAYGARDIHLAATNGFSGGYRRTDRSLYCVAIAGEGLGMESDYDGDMRVFACDLRGAEDIGKRAAARAVARLDPRKPPTGTYPVLFDERISSSLVGHLLAAINGSAISRGASFLRDSLGEKVLPDGMDLIEDPHRPRVVGSRPFDAEGLATKKRAIVKDGVLQDWTLDLATARKLGRQSTANAARSVAGSPSPSPWNVALSQGDATVQDLLGQMGTGLWVTDMIGSTINANTGDYSRGASGVWVENGEAVYAVNEVTIAGNLREMLGEIIPANDARDYLSRVVPSLMIPSMTLAGS